MFQFKTKLDYIFFICVSLLFFISLIIMNPQVSMIDSDAYWHIENGRYMIENKVILDYAIHTFQEGLPYVPHEIGFQLIVGFLYNIGGWIGVYILTVLCMFFTLWGMFKLAKLSKKEAGLGEEITPLFLLIIIILGVITYIMFFHIRPQIMSAPVILWFFIWMREFQYNPTKKHIIILFTLSLLLSNVHTGVWVVIFVFYGMLLLDNMFHKTLNKLHIITFLFIILGGVLNAGGYQTLLYFTQVNEYNDLLGEWQPISSRKDIIHFTLIALFVWSVQYSVKNNIFRLMFALGILFLSLAGYKHFLFLLLFLPYFLSPAVDSIKNFKRFNKHRWMLNKKYIIGVGIIGLLLNISFAIREPLDVVDTKFPKQEMDYILSNYDNGVKERPRVLTEYGPSGYVMFRGGDILADGRYDPFVSNESKEKTIYQWSNFERQYYGFNKGFLIEVIKYDKPDYLILPISTKEKTSKINEKDVWLAEIKKELGQPDYIGNFGEVYDLRDYLNK